MSLRNWIAVGLLAVAIGAVYGPFLNGPFVYDDNAVIVQNSSIKSLWPMIGPLIHNNPGQVLLRAGRTTEAVEQFQAAVCLKPDDVQSFFGLAQALAKIGRPQEAAATAQQAIRLARAANLADAAKQMGDWLAQYQAQGSGAPKPNN